MLCVLPNKWLRQVSLKLSRHLFASMAMCYKTYLVVETHFLEGTVSDNRFNLDVHRNIQRCEIFSVRSSCELVKYDHPLPFIFEY